MPYHVIDNFAKGLDLRRPEMGAIPGTLSIGENVHISRGGTIQKRLGFIPKYTLPTSAQTKGLATVNGALYVFGHQTAGAVTMPPGINYQQLEHPTGEALTNVLSVDKFDGKLYVAASFTDGSIYQFYDGAIVTDLADGRARGLFQITGGTGAGSITSITVDGVEVLGSAVTWATSNVATAAAVAAQINSFTSSPNYTAASVDAVVYVIHPTAGADKNGLTLTVTPSGTVTIAGTTDLQGGLAGAVATGRFVKTYKQKLYTTAGSLAMFSGIARPNLFNQTAVGSGAINLANHAAGSETLQSIVEYISYLVFFAEEAAQIWSMVADPEQNVLVQSVAQIGAVAPRAVGPFGESDIFFLTASGVRALRPSATTANLHVTAPVSEAIDTLLIDAMLALDPTVISNALSFTEPSDGRHMIALGDTVYVLSYFPGVGLSAWSTYKPGFTITDYVILDRKLYVRAGDTIYLYGGDTGLEYDTCIPRARIPNIIASAPATYKGFTGIDIACTGEWEFSIAHTPDDPGTDLVAVVYQGTYPEPSIPMASETTHLTVELVGKPKAEKQEIVNLALHFLRHDSD